MQCQLQLQTLSEMTTEVKFIERILQNRIVAHILFWLSTLIIFPLFGMSFGLPFAVGFLIKLFFLPIQIIATCYLIYYQIPTFLYQKKYVKFGLSLFISALIFCTLAHLSEDFGLTKFLSGYRNTVHTFWEILANPFANIGYNAEDIYLTVFLVTGLKFIKQRIEKKTQIEVLTQEKVTAEINLLKAQINPKILSKTLHQLHILTKEKSDAAPEVVIKLSEMLDYMLYQCNSPSVLINNEIELIQNYLDLEKLRFGDNININFFHDLTNQSAEIAPLLLVSLVETAFLKKGEALPTDAKVEIILQEKEEKLDFKILSNLANEETIEVEDFKKQLALLYPNQHKLKIETKGAVCVLDLSLNLVPATL